MLVGSMVSQRRVGADSMRVDEHRKIGSGGTSRRGRMGILTCFHTALLSPDEAEDKGRGGVLHLPYS